MKNTTKKQQRLTAYEVSARPLSLCRGDRARPWMDASIDRFAYRCLPLLIANQVGWDLMCPVTFTAVWNGGVSNKDVTIQFSGESSDMVGSHFGNGVVTFSLGYLFRTPKTHNMWVKGVPNLPKDGACALEGIVETDWAPYPFTMNWKLTRPDHEVTFEAGEPICRILPYPRHYIAKMSPRIESIHADAALYDKYIKWFHSRSEFNAELASEGSEANAEKWQRRYMRGVDQDDTTFGGHQTKVAVPEFKRGTGK